VTRPVALAFALAAFALAGVAPTSAADTIAELRYENRHFVPASLSVQAGQAMTLKVVNASKEAIEFESFKLNRERAVQPGQSTLVHLPALSPGSYDFRDDFHQDVPQGSIVAR